MAFTPDLLRRRFRVTNKLARNLIAEFFGTFVLLFIGTSIIAQFILTKEKVNTWVQINIGWGFDIIFSVYLVARVSGGHLNPAISLVMLTFGNLTVGVFFLYCIVQVIGAFFGAMATYIVYYDAINMFDGGNRSVHGPTATANIFATYPAPYLTMRGAYVDQMVGTGFLALFVAAVVDKRNKIPEWIHPVLFGLSVLLIGTCYGMNVGYPINPARDIGPRLFTLFFYGSDVFTYPYKSWFLVPIAAPMIGALIGAWSYYIFAGIHIPDDEYEAVPQIRGEAERLHPKSAA